MYAATRLLYARQHVPAAVRIPFLPLPLVRNRTLGAPPNPLAFNNGHQLQDSGYCDVDGKC